MSQIILALSPEKFQKIIDQDIRFPEPAAGQSGLLYKGGSAALNIALDETWEQIREALNTAFHHGWEAAKDFVQKVKDKVKDTSERLGQEAALYRARLLEKLQEALQETYNLMLGSLKQQVMVGEIGLPLKGIEIEFKLVLTGSVEVSLTSLCKAAASGEMTIKGSYGFADV